MKRIFYIAAFLLVGVLTGWAQNEIDDKLSITTQLFLNELNGKAEFNPSTSSNFTFGNYEEGESFLPDRLFVTPDTIEGKVYISCYVRLDDNSDTSELDALGVIVENKFVNGLVTALIPIDKIMEVAEIGRVSRINVSPLNKPLTNAARAKTNTDDVLTLSNDARNLGLMKSYDGTGVLLGVIDTGIDFQHIAFKDKNGNSRIKGAYVYDGSSAKEYSSISSSAPTTDDKTADHGTHTSTTAGGSSVVVSGSTVTVTDDHANASYGGMAPGADLYLAGVNGLDDTHMSNALASMVSYADSHNMPLVVSNSWGSQLGPHDGTGDFADVIATYFGDNHPNHVCLFASSNDAGLPKDGEGGGYYLTGTASSSNTLKSILRAATYINTDAGYYYYGIVASAWCRSTSVSSMACKIHVLNAKTGAIVASTTVTPSANGATVSGLSSYYSGTLYAYKDVVSSNKTQIVLYAPNGLTSRSYSNNSDYYTSNYTLAVEFYPTSGTATIDVWGGTYGYFTNYLKTSGYDWKAGSDDMSVSDEATDPNVISIGAYVSKNSITNYNGTLHDSTDEYTMDDIASFSSYATASASPTGLRYPWITAPGARLVSGVNHYHTTSVDNYSYYGSNYNNDLVVNSTTSPYAAMEGTSMATPAAAGIVALWMQAAKEEGIDMTVNDIKNVMRETAINDSYTTTGANASHFGNGKIDALAGIKYIVGDVTEPTIKANPKSVTFSTEPNEADSKTVTVSSRLLTGDVSVTLNDANHVFSVSTTTISKSDSENGYDLNIGFSAAEEGNYQATITLSSAGAETVTINLTGEVTEIGKASDAFLNIAKYETIGDAGWDTYYVNNLYKYTEDTDNEVAWLTLPIYGAWSSVYYSPKAQNWIKTNVTSTSNKYAGTTWNSSDKLLGSSPYFTSATARGMGYNSRTNSTQETVTFYVKNTTAVKMLGLGQSRSSSSYPATLKIYECTLNSDGSLNEGTTAVKSESNSATSGTFVLSATGLDASKIYKVETATYRSLICEVGFETPLPVVTIPTITATPAELSVTTPAGTSKAVELTVKGVNLTENLSVALNDANNVFSIDKQTFSATEAANSPKVNVTFSPENAGSYSASITLSSTDAESVVVNITGVATQPAITVTPAQLTMETEAGTPTTATFNVTGVNLADVVNVQVNDDNGVFAIDTERIDIENAEEGVDVTVTFSPSEVGTYNGSVTISSSKAESATVELQGTATKPVPEYFDVTISSVGLSTLYLDFPVVIPYDTYDPDLLGVYYVYAIDGTILKQARLNSVIPANTGVIVHGNEGTYRFPSDKNSTYQLPRNNYLSGSTERILTSEALAQSAYPDGKLYTLGRGGSDNFINFYIYSGEYLSANKAFLIVAGDTSTDFFSFDNQGEDGISLVKTDDENGGWFTLQGIKLNGKPTQRGIYIHNGNVTSIK